MLPSSPSLPPLRFNMARYFLDARLDEGLGDKVALICGEERTTYQELVDGSNQVADLLRKKGLKPKERVIICCPDGLAYVLALFGIVKAGGVVVMVNPNLQADEVDYFIEYSGASAAFVHSQVVPMFQSGAESSLRLTICVDGKAPGCVDLQAERDEYSTESKLASTHREDPAIWLFSGGTTGRPKAVVQPHQSFYNTCEAYAKNTIGYTTNDITLSVPKLYFGYATGSNLLFPFAAGATSVLFPERCTPETLFAQIQQHRPSILINVPTMVGKLLDSDLAGQQDLSSLRLATSAGEALPAPLHQRWNETFGVELLDGLGTAEMWHVFLSNSPGAVRPGSLGQVVPGFEIRVRDSEGQDLPDGEIGNMWVRGGSLGQGYWQLPEKTAEAFRDGWYVSSDMMRRDSEGYFYFCGRGDDMLKVGGKWLAPKEVEGCLLDHPAVAECAVVGISDGAGLIKPQAFVRARGETQGVADLLMAHVRKHLEPYKAPRAIHFLDDFPRTHLGKIDRGALRTQASS